MGKGGGKQSTPYEAPNDLKSRQKLSIIDLISEGPIEGPVKGLQSVHLDDTPAVDDGGNSSVNGMVAQWRAGTLEQPVMEGFTDSSSETPVGIEIKQSAPVTRTITTPNIDRLRLTFGTQSLMEVTEDGSRVPTAVQLQVQIQRNGAWVTEKDVTIRGKRSNSPYMMAVVLDNLPPRPFSVRMVRITPDSTTDRIQNTTVWSSYTEITDIAQTYPGSAVVGLNFDSEQFGNKFPRRNYLVRGRIVQVPDNYDPVTRTYNGIWTGAFKPAWSDNPAFVLYDLLTHPRYGMGKRLNVGEVDKFALYAIGQYCDQSVPNGFGGREPRMRCNAYLTDLRKAYDIVSELCAMMRVMPVWDGRRMTFIQDRPSDVVWPYTNANVVGGAFGYSASSLKARHTVVEVRFIDPDNGWKTSVEQVSDDAMVARFGRNVLRVDAFGCTSRGQAHRHGLWILTTEKLETQTVEFAVGAEGLRHTPGDIIEVADNDYVDAQIGGRLVSVDEKTNTLTLDRPVEKPAKGQATLSLMDATGQPVRLTVTGFPAANQLQVNGLPAGVREGGVWALGLPSLRRRLFRAITVSDKGDGTYAVSAVQHVPEKEAIVDNGARFDPKPDTNLSTLIPPVEHLAVELTQDTEAWQVVATWDTPYAARGISFVLKLTVGGRIVGTATTTDSLYRFGGLPRGDYTLTVTAQNTRGQKGEPTSVTFSINPPAPPSYIDVEPGYFSLGVIPRTGGMNALRTQFEFWYSDRQLTDITTVTARAQYLGTGTLWVVQGQHIKPGHRYYFYVRSVNAVGKSNFVEASGEPRDDARGILDIIAGQILESDLGKALQDKINSAITEANLKDIEKQIETVRDQLGADAAALDKQLADASERLDSLAKAQIETSIGLQQEKQERGEREAWIVDRQNTLESDTQSVAEDVKQLGANFDGQQATLTTLEKTVSNNEKATATSLKQLESRTQGNESSIKSLSQTVATDSKATAEQLSKLDSKVGENAAGITQLKQSQSDLEGSQAQIAQGLEANAKATIQNSLNQVEGEQRQAAVSATLKTTQEVIANQQEAHAKQLTTLTANFDTASASLTRLDETVAREKEATSRALRDMSSQVGENKSSITQEAKTRADADKALGERITQVRSETVDSVAQALDQVKTVSEAQQASGSRIQSLEASAAIDNTPEGLIEQALGLHEQGKERRKAEAKIIHEQSVIANQQEAVAKEQTTLKAQMGENTAQLQQVSEVQADVNGKLSATWMVKVEVDANGNPVVGGVALGVDSEGNSQFLVDANRFAIINRANGQVVVPFVIQNGQMFVNEGFINYAAITLAKIGELRSSNYVPGRSGTIMKSDGTFEISGKGSAGQLTIQNNSIRLHDSNGVLRVAIGEY
ncbi:phage tail tip protein J-related protein [Serratia sp. 2C06]|uniref:phage tail tip protein J-related protein n=1 Tax=Serratia sp. 2C06 TaxID=3416180 RepID=UPI003CECE682